MKQLFEEYEYWRKIKNYFKKTKHPQQSQIVYKVTKKIPGTKFKKGDFIYIDNAHKNHIELFSKGGSQKAVIMLDGTVDEMKTLKVQSQNRTFKKG